MSKTYPVRNSFNSGELSELIDFRDDISKYAAGCKVLENAFPLVEGGAKKFPGSYYVNPAKNSGYPCRMVPFVFSTSQAYVLEFGNQYIRFYVNGSQITSSYSAWITSYYYNCGALVTSGGNYYRCIVAHASGTFATDLSAKKWVLTNGATDLAYEIPSPYLQADLFDLDVETQSADELYIFHHSYQPATLLRISSSSFILVTPNYLGTSLVAKVNTGAKSINNIYGNHDVLALNIPNHQLTLGQRVYLSDFVSLTNMNNKVCTAIWIDSPSKQAYDPYAACGAGGNKIFVGNWAEFDFGGGRSLYINCPYGSWDGTQAIITITSNTTDNLSVTLSGNHITIYLANATPSNNYGYPIVAAMQALAKTNSDALDLGGMDDGSEWSVTPNAAYNANPPTSNFGSITQLMSNEESVYTCNVACAGIFPPVSPSYFTVYTQALDANGVGIAATNPALYVTTGSGGMLAPLAYLFNDSGDYPACGTLFQERLCMAGSDNEQDKLYGSTQSDYPDFVCDPNSEDYSIQFSLVSPKVDPILNAIGSPNGLLLGTASGVWVVSGASGAALSQNSIETSKQTSLGVGKLSPQLVSDSVIFTSRSLREVIFLVYNFTSNQWDNFDLTRLNRQITLGATKETSGIIQTAFQSEPYPIFWAVRADGQLIGLIFNKQDQVFAWFRINMPNGIIESVAVIPQAGDEDQIWISVQRTINNQVVRYIEYFTPQEIFGELSNAFFVHCGTRFNMGSPALISGITNASICSVYSPGHGFTTGQNIRITDVQGMTQVNQNPSQAYTITVTDVNNYTLNNIASTSWSAYSEGGTALPVTNQVSGMSYIEGQSVVAVGDGYEIFQGTVPSNGVLTFSTYANCITVGIPYKMTVQPMNPILSSQGQTSRGMKQKLNKVTVSLYQSIGGVMGTNQYSLYDIEYGK